MHTLILKILILNKFMSTGTLALLLMTNLAGDHTLLAHVKQFKKICICCHSSDTLWKLLSASYFTMLIFPLPWPYVYTYMCLNVCNCLKDRLPDRHSCLNLYPCVIKVLSLSLSLLKAMGWQVNDKKLKLSTDPVPVVDADVSGAVEVQSMLARCFQTGIDPTVGTRFVLSRSNQPSFFILCVWMWSEDFGLFAI